MTEKRRAPESVCRDLCEAVIHYGIWPKVLEPHVDAYRVATAPLRTRASVDAEIAGYVRAWWAGATSLDYNAPIHSRHCISKLCREPTAEEPTAAPKCSVCDDNGYTHDCMCKFAHSCKVCFSGAEYERGGRMLNLNRKP